MPTGKGITTIPNTAAMAGPAQMTQIATDVDRLLDNSVATAADLAKLPTVEKWPGRHMIARDTKGVYLFTGTAWELVYLPWTTFTPTLGGVTLGSSPTNLHRYKISNGEVFVFGWIKLGPGGSFGDVQVPFPLTPTQALPDIFPLGTCSWVDSDATTAGRYLGNAYMVGTNPAIRLTQISTLGVTVVGPPFSSRDPDAVTYNVRYPI